MLVALFRARFDPAAADDDLARRQAGAIRTALEKVTNLSEDRVLRQYVAVIEATLRTSFWRVDGEGRRRPYLSFKLDPAKVPGMPAPAPLFEIWVYAPRFEGVHLRGGKVSRGGLRWSDRPEDFRTEVLGLVKAQMVKNTVIVPVGSKGGFVLKRAPSPADRDAYLKEGIACYQDYLRGLLDDLHVSPLQISKFLKVTERSVWRWLSETTTRSQRASASRIAPASGRLTIGLVAMTQTALTRPSPIARKSTSSLHTRDPSQSGTIPSGVMR